MVSEIVDDLSCVEKSTDSSKIKAQIYQRNSYLAQENPIQPTE
jgi:hypothetical protein